MLLGYILEKLFDQVYPPLVLIVVSASVALIFIRIFVRGRREATEGIALAPG
jgi:hypothetical protein